MGSAYLQSKQGEPIPDSMGTNRSSLYAVLIERTERNVSLLFVSQISCRHLWGAWESKMGDGVGEEVGREMQGGVMGSEANNILREEFLSVLYNKVAMKYG